MQIVAFKPKCPILLLTGFLGSGKTSLLAHLLREVGAERRIAVIQNEFAQSNIDGEILREVAGEFTMRELNTGSIFCACLFSQFQSALKELAQRGDVGMVIVEATGIADPIAIAQLLEDKTLNDAYYLSRIISVVDAPRFESVLSRISGVKHQIQVADIVVVNKIDLVDEQTLQRVGEVACEINPLSRLIYVEQGRIKMAELLEGDLNSAIKERGINGELTKCGEGGYVSRSYKASHLVKRESLELFLNSLGEDILRLKGYVTLEDGVTYVVQYVPSEWEIAPLRGAMGRLELISIGFSEPDFTKLIN
ncbi:MAG: GTP-binding protein [Rikenellaceae bacterium]